MTLRLVSPTKHVWPNCGNMGANLASIRHDDELLREEVAVKWHNSFDDLIFYWCIFDVTDLLCLRQGSFGVTLLFLFCAYLTACCTRPLVLLTLWQGVRSTRGVPGEHQGSTREAGGIISSLAHRSSALLRHSVPRTTEKKIITDDVGIWQLVSTVCKSNLKQSYQPIRAAQCDWRL